MTKPDRILSLAFLLTIGCSLGALESVQLSHGVSAARKTTASSSLRLKGTLPPNASFTADPGKSVPIPSIATSAAPQRRPSPSLAIKLFPNVTSGLEITPPRRTAIHGITTATELLPGTMVRFKRITDPASLFATETVPAALPLPDQSLRPVSASPATELASGSAQELIASAPGLAPSTPAPEDTLPLLILPGGPEFRIFPGTVCKAGHHEVTLLLGRIRVEVAEDASSTAILGRYCRFELTSGKAMVQVDTDSNTIFALADGEGWVRGADRSEDVLTAGKGITVDRSGKLGKIGEIDPRLQEIDTLPTFGPTAWLRPVEMISARSSSANASDAMLASDTVPASDTIVASDTSLASMSMIASAPVQASAPLPPSEVIANQGPSAASLSSGPESLTASVSENPNRAIASSPAPAKAFPAAATASSTAH